MKKIIKIILINGLIIATITYLLSLFYKDESVVYKSEYEARIANESIRNLFAGKKIDTLVFAEYDSTLKKRLINITNGVIVFTPLDGCQSCIAHHLACAKALKDSINLFVVFPAGEFQEYKSIKADYGFSKILIDTDNGLLKCLKRSKFETIKPIVVSVRDGIIYSVSFNTLSNSVYMSHAYNRHRINTSYK